MLSGGLKFRLAEIILGLIFLCPPLKTQSQSENFEWPKRAADYLGILEKLF